MTSVTHRRIAKLRASCDACNESKVRCSQAKPCCARCEKHGIHCVYGLSRRSHKNAPRIGASHESAATAAVVASEPGSSSPSDPIRSSRGRSMTAPTTTSGSSDESHAPVLGLASDAALSSLINMQSSPGRLYEDLAHHPDFSLVSSEPVSLSVSAGYDFLDHHMAGSSLDYPGMHAGFMDYDLPSEPEDREREREREREMEKEREPAVSLSSCNCVSRLLEELASLPSLSKSSSSSTSNRNIPGRHSGSSGASFDAQLSQLRRAINVSADCLSCHCNTQDEMSIMTISLLMGRVIQSLDQTLLRASSCSSSSSLSSSSSSSPSSYPPVSSSSRSSTSVSLSTSTPVSTHTAPSTLVSTSIPGLSWGSLQIDPHEEQQLKQHLWLLQFRKLERVIDEFSQSVGKLPAAGQSAHLMACRCLHLWLMQKAEGLRARYRTQDVGRD